MADQEYDIFISYRRVGGSHYARILKAELEKRGYRNRVFLDYDELVDGKFDHRIMRAIESAPIFIIVLSPGSLDRCVNEDDWVRQELLHAFKKERHIIPVNFDGLFTDFAPNVPKEIKRILGQHQFSKIDSEQLLNVSIEKLINERILPFVEPNPAQAVTHSHNKGAEIVILADCDCEVYRFGKLLGKAETGSELIINLLKGNHLIEFVSVAYPNVRNKQKLSIPDNDYTDFIEVKLKDKIDETIKKAEEIYKDGVKFYKNGIRQNYDKAFKLFSESAELGNAAAQYKLGEMYHVGRSVSCNFKEAVKWYSKASSKGFAKAQYKLGVMYDNGWGVPQNYSEAMKWYHIAATQDFADAQCNLGDCYYYGQGVDINYVEAINWYRKAIDQGHARAQYNLGYCYEYGHGVNRNSIKAAEWFHKAAEQGYARAQYRLGVCYEYGLGVTKDIVESIKWFRKAAEQGDSFAIKQLKILGKSL